MSTPGYLTYSVNSTVTTLNTSNVLYNPYPSVVYKYGDPLWAVPAEAAPKPESDLDWLERRVEEISWVPA